MPKSALTVALLVGLWFTTQESEPNGQQHERSVVITGCIQGGVLNSITPDKTDSANVLTAGRTYRLTGKKEVVKQIRQDHEGHLLEVAGTIDAGREPTMVTNRKKAGKATVYVGKGQSGTAARAPEFPTLKVEDFRLVHPWCPKSNLGR